MISIAECPATSNPTRTGLGLVVSLLLLFFGSGVFAQGNVGALPLQQEFKKKYSNALPKSLSSEAKKDSLRAYERTGKPGSGEKLNSAGILGEANLALVEDASVKPAVMAKVMFQKRDYLGLMAQLLFGDTSVEGTSANVAANLFVPEASRYALNLLGTWRPAARHKRSKECALNFGFYYALKELPADSTLSLEDVGVLHAHVGVEYIVYRGGLSIYVDGHVLSNQQNEEDYDQVFGADAPQTFTYFAPGVRVKFSDKLFVDLELMIMNNDMKTVRGNDDGVMPLFRLGFSQSVFGLD